MRWLRRHLTRPVIVVSIYYKGEQQPIVWGGYRSNRSLLRHTKHMVEMMALPWVDGVHIIKLRGDICEEERFLDA